MAGYIVYNGFWNPHTLPDPVQRLQEAAQQRGWTLTPIPNTALPIVIGASGALVPGMQSGDVVLFWDKDIRLGQALTTMGAHLYNPIDAVAVCDDKGATHLALAAQGIPMPRTLLAPMTYRDITDPIDMFLRRAVAELSFPMVVKECYGSLGGQVYLAHDSDELRGMAMSMGSKPFLVQEFMRAAAGEDLRLYVVGHRVVAAMRRHSETDFRSNIAAGGQGEVYIPTPEQEQLALRCCRVLGLAFGGVDLLWDVSGTPVVCEVNSNAFMGGITACTGVDVAGAIVEYVRERERLVP